MNSIKKVSLLFLLSGVTIFLGACVGPEKAKGPGELEGRVAIDGSGTVYPFMALMAENYMVNEHEDVSVEVSRAGTSAGFKKFLAKNGTDFNNASREIKDKELAEAKKLGIHVQELKVALDGITIVINKENDWATELTQEEVIDIFLASKGKTKWSDVRPGFPNKPIKTYGPNENHGTYEFMYETILGEQDLIEGINLQQDYSTLVDLISKEKNAIGFFGYGYYASNKDKLSAVKVDFGDGPVEPTFDTISEDGAYAPFTRPIFTYLNADLAKEKRQVFDFARYLMENSQEVAKETGFAPIADEDVNESLARLNTLK